MSRRSFAAYLPLALSSPWVGTALVVLTLSIRGAVDAQEQTHFLRGDANQDHVVDISDSVRLLLYQFSSGVEAPCLDAMDADDSGSVTVGDPLYLLRFLFLNGSAIPTPFPECGPDLTEDTLDCATSACPPASIWSTRARPLEAYSEFSVAQLDGKIYLFGGYPSTRITVNVVQVYDASEDRWSYGTPLPLPVNHTMAAAVGDKLYLIGGQTGTSGNGPFVNKVYEYEPAKLKWTERAPMPTRRSSGAAAVISDRIYVAGGRPPRGNDFAVYDTSDDTWTTLPNLPTQRNHLAAAAIDGKVYVAGGRFGAGHTSTLTGALEVFDPETNTWVARAPMPTPRGGVNGIAVHGCFYVFGGEGNDDVPTGVFSENEVYDPLSNRWQSLEPIPIPVHGVTGAAFINGWIHLPGGGIRRGGSSGSRIHQVFRVGMTCR